MKVALLACTCMVLSIAQYASSAAINAPLDIISLEDLSESDRKTLEFIDKYYPRPKRSQDYDLLGTLKSAVGNGIKSKLGLIAKGSASAISHLSGGSSGGGHSYHHYDVPETYDHKTFDFWSLKKSILNTLLQAVKAIKGGVIAIKGQLIKGSGYLISAKGKLISSKGEAITSLGKNIASSAVLSPYPHHHSGPEHIEYPEPHAHYHSSGPSDYGSPSAPGPEYDVPDHHPHHDDKPDADHAGILIIKKIPSDHHHHADHHHGDHSDAHAHYVPDFKPLEPSGPGFGAIVGKFFSASTSLKPGEPAPFGDEPHAHEHQHEHHEHQHEHHEHQHEHHEHQHEHHEHQHDHHDHHDHQHAHHEPPKAHEYAPDTFRPPSGPSGPDFALSAPSQVENAHLKPPSTNYGVPFEQSPAFLADYPGESKKQPQTATKPTGAGLEGPKYDEVRPLHVALGANYNSGLFEPYKSSFSTPTAPGASVQQFPVYQPNKGLTAPDFGLNTFGQFGAFEQPGNGEEIKYLAPPPLSLGDSVGDFNSPQGFLRKPAPVAAPLKASKGPKRPAYGKTRTYGKNPQGFDVVRSIGYELGPNGPKRL